MLVADERGEHVTKAAEGSGADRHGGELAGLTGISTRGIRHYHRVGLLAESARTENGYWSQARSRTGRSG
ncbi:MAG: MerR family DNA-binding transcriptional regulator [Streptosporangiaceae bacterium]|nr:MerR family DNA-binding transcriptional regulator [Streptosporangiaceae bacterium]